MKREKVVIEIYLNGKHIVDQDVSVFTAAQVREMIKVKEEHGLECIIRCDWSK